MTFYLKSNTYLCWQQLSIVRAIGNVAGLFFHDVIFGDDYLQMEEKNNFLPNSPRFTMFFIVLLTRAQQKIEFVRLASSVDL